MKGLATTRYESLLAAHDATTGHFGSAMANASATVRRKRGCSTAREVALQDVAAGVAAPTVVGFVFWILSHVHRLDLERIYFLARDGQLLLEVAHVLARRLNLAVELRYLYGGRQAWVLPSLTEGSAEELSCVFPAHHDVDFLSVRIQLARLDLRPELLEQSLVEGGFPPPCWERNLDRVERAALHQLAASHEGIRAAILSKARQRRRPLLGYLRQEGLCEDVSAAIVDLGTGLTLYRALSLVLHSIGQSPPRPLYLGLRALSTAVPTALPEPYFFDVPRGRGFFDVPGLIPTLESTCSAYHSPVVDYETRGQRVEPKLVGDHPLRVRDWGHPLVREAVLGFAEQLAFESVSNPFADLRSMIVELLTAFWVHPTQEEAVTWGSFPMEDGWGGEAVWIRLAEPYRWRSVPWMIRHRSLKLRRHWWTHGALRLTPLPLRALLRLLRWLRIIKPMTQPRN